MLTDHRPEQLDSLPPRKRWGVHKSTGIAAASVALLLAGCVTWFLNTPATSNCAGDAPAGHEAHEIRAAKVVVQPWLGQHHVYGLFIVPNRFKHNEKYAATVTIRGSDRQFAVDERPHTGYEDQLDPPPGHYVVHSHLQTRLALWFLITGVFDDLRHPCNWTLVFVENRRDSERSERADRQ